MATLEEWGEAGSKYRVHEETLQYFAEIRALGEQPLSSLPVPAARQQFLNRALKLAGGTDWNGEVREFKVPAPAVPGGIPLEVYRPTELTQSPPVLVWFHGGGHVVGSRKTVEVMCKAIAKEAKCVVANVEYRLAPEHRPPADFDDAVCVMRWTIMNKALLGGTIESLVGVGGDSAGGQLAASVCFDVPGIAFQVLVYPDTDWRHGHPSFEEFALTPGLNKDMVAWFRGHYLTDESQESDPRYSPLLRADHSRLPPALIIVAELDPLKDCCYAYKHKLSEAGVQVESFTLKGVPHAFFNLPGHYKQTCTKAYGKVCTFIQKFDKRRNNKLFHDSFRTSR